MKTRILFAGAESVALVALTVMAADEVKLEGIKCVMNPKAAAKADKFVEYKGGKVFFCCENCPKKFDAEKCAVPANHQLVATKQAKQAKCPISGEPCKAEHKVAVGGVDVFFCCPDCKAKVADAKGDEQMKLVFSNEAFAKAYKVAK